MADKFNDMTRNEEGYSLRRLSYPYTAKNSKMFEEDEENININNGNINENIYHNYLNQKEEQKLVCKKIDFQDVPEETNKKKENEKEKEISSDSQLLIPEIMKVYQKAKKFDYSFDLINVNFKDFIHNFSFENDENKNINNIQNNNSNNITNTNSNSNKKKSTNESYSPLSQTCNYSIENNNINNSNQLGKYIILENGKKQINKDLIKCNCKNSNCLKFYCECFSNGKYCNDCPCCNCHNKIEFESLRQEKYKNIISRNPKAILQINSTKKSWTCNCKNSNCTKKYCDCFQNGKSCTSKCKCINCFNKISVTNNNNGKIRRIRGAKKLIQKNLFITPKKKRKIRKNNNQSTADFTGNRNNHNRKNIFKNTIINNKNKSINKKLYVDNL